MRSLSSRLHRRRRSRPVMISTDPLPTDLKLRFKLGFKVSSVRQHPAHRKAGQAGRLPTGTIGPLFKAARIALPPNIREAEAG
jgi:hypothetical protein